MSTPRAEDELHDRSFAPAATRSVGVDAPGPLHAASRGAARRSDWCQLLLAHPRGRATPAGAVDARSGKPSNLLLARESFITHGILDQTELFRATLERKPVEYSSRAGNSLRYMIRRALVWTLIGGLSLIGC